MGFDTGFGSEPFGIMFRIVPIMVVGGFILVFGMFIFIIIKSISRWSYNNSQPVLTVEARVVAKRTNVSSGMHHGAGDTGMHHHHTNTYYYITFEVESGDRMELQVMDHEFGLLAEGDTGRLTFQGARFKGFKRNLSDDPRQNSV